MKFPIPCPLCGDVTELHDMRTLNDKLVCLDCIVDEEERQYLEELEYELDKEVGEP